jgi:hypothetical protein
LCRVRDAPVRDIEHIEEEPDPNPGADTSGLFDPEVERIRRRDTTCAVGLDSEACAPLGEPEDIDLTAPRYPVAYR